MKPGTVPNTLAFAMSIINCVVALARQDWELAGAWLCSTLGWLGMLSMRYNK